MVKRFDVYLVNLDPTVGHEIKKHRPCLVISPDELNRNISTVIVAPMTTKGRNIQLECRVHLMIKKVKYYWSKCEQLIKRD